MIDASQNVINGWTVPDKTSGVLATPVGHGRCATPSSGISQSNAFRSLAEGAARDHAWLVSLGRPAEGLRAMAAMAEAECCPTPMMCEPAPSHAALIVARNLEPTRV